MADRQTDRYIDINTDRQTDRQTQTVPEQSYTDYTTSCYVFFGFTPFST